MPALIIAGIVAIASMFGYDLPAAVASTSPVVLMFGALFAALAFTGIYLYLKAPQRIVTRFHASEDTFECFPGEPGCKSKSARFEPRLVDEGSKPTEAQVTLSVIIPAYNEEERISVMLDETLAYLRKRHLDDPAFSYELIIVDDGSKDATASIVLKYAQRVGGGLIRLLSLAENHGKGGAVCKGMVRARGELLLMADADGATKFRDVERLEKSMRALGASVASHPGAIAVGSRAHLADDASVKRSGLRNILMHCFHFAVATLCVRGVRDTQCGFKLFSRTAAQRIFPNQHIARWVFDCELLYLASVLGIAVVEQGVEWEEIPGSKLNVAIASLQMLRDLVVIRLCYALRVWSAHDAVPCSNVEEETSKKEK